MYRKDRIVSQVWGRITGIGGYRKDRTLLQVSGRIAGIGGYRKDRTVLQVSGHIAGIGKYLQASGRRAGIGKYLEAFGGIMQVLGRFAGIGMSCRYREASGNNLIRKYSPSSGAISVNFYIRHKLGTGTSTRFCGGYA